MVGGDAGPITERIKEYRAWDFCPNGFYINTGVVLVLRMKEYACTVLGLGFLCFCVIGIGFYDIDF